MIPKPGGGERPLGIPHSPIELHFYPISLWVRLR
jgi:hypothetical protein